MLKCSEVVEKADALVDDETLGFGERLSLRMHLIMCRHCRRYVRQFKQLVQHLQRPMEPAPQEAVRRIMAALERETRNG